MKDKEREELQRKLEQSRRLMSDASDPTTRERLKKMAVDIEDQLREAE